MALSVKCGTFALNTGTGSQSITGLGFQPKVVFFLNQGDTADIATDVANFHQSFGVATGSLNQWVMYSNSINGQTTSDSINTIQTGKCVLAYDPPGGSGTVDYSANLTSLDSGGFTINVLNAPGVGYVVGYLALGGSDIINANATSFVWSAAGTGNHSVTGIGFQPNAILVSGGDSVDGSLANNARFNIGVAAGANQGNMYLSDADNQGTSSAARNMLATRINNQNSDAGANQVAFVSFDADGFTYNTVTNPPTGRTTGLLALNCTSVGVGTVQLPTTTGAASYTGLGFQPRAGLFFSICNPLSASVNDAQFSFGMAESALARYVSGGLAKNAAAVSITSHFSTSQGVYRSTTALPGTVDEAADFSSWDSDGFTLDVETALGASAAQVHYLVFGGAAPASDPGGSGGQTGTSGSLGGFGDEF